MVAKTPIRPVILCGGTGTRLWPLSRRERPKQFLALNGDKTLFQQTVLRVANANVFAAPIIATSEIYLEIVESQLSEIGVAPSLILVEPEPRNTAPAIALAALNADKQELLLVTPSDHAIADEKAFHSAVEAGRILAEQEWLVTFGITPTRAETGYGYVHQGEGLSSGSYAAAGFTEKPDSKRAQCFLDEGGSLWNAGIFLFRADAYLAALETHGPQILAATREAVAQQVCELGCVRPDGVAFAAAPVAPIDRAVMEKSSRVAVVPFEMGWSDIGSWDSLFKTWTSRRSRQQHYWPDRKPMPNVGVTDALVRITTTTICGTDVHILKGEYPVAKGLTVGHEPVGVIEKLGSAVTGYEEGQRVIAGAITPSGHSYASLCGCHSQDGPGTRHGFKPMGGWRFGNTIDGCQAEFVLVPDAIANLSPIPDHLTDEQVLMCPDIMSTGFAGAERGKVRIGDVVAVFALGPIGLCAVAGAKLRGATKIIGVDTVPARMQAAKKLGADHVIDFAASDPVSEILRLTNGRGVDVAIEALGTQGTFQSALRVLRPAGTLSSLGVYSGDLVIPADAFSAGLGDHKIVTSLCPGGKERMRRLMAVIESGRVDLSAMVTHRFALDQIEDAYELFANQRDGVLKIAITP